MKTSNLPKRHKPVAKPRNEYECEVINDYLPRKFDKLRKRFGFTEKILKVTHRREDLMTGSGFPRHCHGNVRHMVEHIGGEQLLGFWIEDFSALRSLPPKSLFAFYWHSVWITPEGKLVDLTEVSTKQQKKYGRRTYSAFIPFTKYSEGKWMQGRATIVAGFDYKREGIIFPTENNTKVTTLPFLAMKRKSSIVRTVKRTTEGLYEGGVFGGGFSKPSSATGKYFQNARTQNNHKI